MTADLRSATSRHLTELHEGHRTWVPILRSRRYAWRSAAYSTTYSPITSEAPTSPGAPRTKLAEAGAGRQRAALPERPDTPLVLVACSGGADSMALASALAFEAPKLSVRAGGITVDHGLQDGSDTRAAEVVDRLTAMHLDPVESVAVRVGHDGGPEAAARDARYAALDAAAERHGAAAVLLGHTRDDQAETVLLGLARGSGIRSLSGMAAASGPAGRYRRPFLQLDRQTARKACLVQSLPVWDDPHNIDPAYTRSRLRHEGLPALEKALGKGVVEALARPRSSPATTPTRWTPGPPRPTAPPGTTRAVWSAPSCTRCRPPYAAGSCAGPPWRPAPRPVRSSPGTSRKSTV